MNKFMVPVHGLSLRARLLHRASDRLQRLQALLSDQQKAFNKSMMGQKIEILSEKKGRHTGQIIGRSPYLQSVHIEANIPFGDMIEVNITNTSGNSLTGEI